MPGSAASPARTARVAGLLYLAMMPLAVFALWVRFGVVVPGDAAATAAKAAAAEPWLRAAIVSWLASQALFIFLLLKLYALFRPVHVERARLMVALGLAGVPIAFANELNQLAVLLLTSATTDVRAFDPAQVQSAVLFLFRLHDHGIYIAHVFWGLWLLPFGALVFRCGFLPRWLGVLLIVAGAGYLADFLRYMCFPRLEVTVTQFTFVGELLLPLWLVFRGGDAARWSSNVVAS